jgi:hypothetical protein
VGNGGGEQQWNLVMIYTGIYLINRQPFPK